MFSSVFICYNIAVGIRRVSMVCSKQNVYRLKMTLYKIHKSIPLLLYSMFVVLITGTDCDAIQHKNTGVRIDIKSLGASGDGITLETNILQTAIDSVHKTGGGVVVIPIGNFLIGSIIMKPDVEINISDNAILRGSTNPNDYKKNSDHLALILADNANDISITGKGTIDGQGLELALAIDSLYHTGEIIDPRYNNYRMRPSESVRPQIINFSNCSDIIIKNVTVKNGSGWVTVYKQCKNIIIDSVTITSTAYWNNDGMDICDCKNVKITNCIVNSADDGICLKSYSRESFNDSIYIANCTIRSSASAIKFGTDSRGGFTNIKIEKIKVYDTYRSAIAIESVDGGIVENIDVSDIEADNTGNAIFIKLGHRNVGGEVGSLKNITMKNLKVTVPFTRPDLEYDLRGPDLPFFHNPFPSSITGIPGFNVENVTLENIEITYLGRATKGMAYVPLYRLNQVPENEKEYPEFSMFGELPAWGFYIRHVDGLTMKNIILRVKENDYRPAFVFDDTKNLTLAGSEVHTKNGEKQIVLNNVVRGEFSNMNVDRDKDYGIIQMGNCELIRKNKSAK
jgi:hypothetical protein